MSSVKNLVVLLLRCNLRRASECLKKILTDKILNPSLINQNRIARLVFDFYSKNAGSNNLTFIETTSSDILYAEHSGNPNPHIIKLNKITLPAASEEFATSVVLHEIVHALLSFRVGIPPNQLEQHKKIFTNWSSDIAEYLLSLYPSLSTSDAFALAIGGVTDIHNDAQFTNTSKYQERITFLAEMDLDLTSAQNRREKYENKSIGTNCN